MDYPSAESVGLLNGKFHDGDPVNNIPASLDRGIDQNAVFDELLAVITEGGLTPDEAAFTQVRDAILAIRSAGTLGGLSDVITATPQVGEAIIYNGTNWVNGVPASIADLLEKKLTLNSLIDTATSGLAKQYIDTFTDPYANLNLVNGGASSGHTFDATNATIHNVSSGSYTANLVPTMTSHTAPEGVASASSETNVAWYAFNKVTASASVAGWQGSGTSGWLQYQFDSAQTITQYTIVGWYSGWTPSNRAPQAWTLRGSNTGAFAGEEVTLDTQTAQTGWGDAEKRTYSFSNSTAYLYYRIVITSNNGGGTVSIIEMEMMASNNPTNMIIQSTQFSTLVVPTRGKFISLVEPVDAVTYGTDLTVDMSRDDGDAWDALTLEQTGATTITVNGSPTDVDVLYGEAAFTGASEQNGRYRWQTANEKQMRVHAVAAQFS